MKQKAASNGEGLWSMRFLNTGTYTVTITAPGFKTVEQKGVTLEVADDKRITTVLNVGATSDVVSITAEAPLIDTSSATAGTVIESRSEEHTSELQSHLNLVCRLLLEKKKTLP